MANAALENLSAAGTVAGTDLVPIKQAGATLLKGTVNQLATGILSGDAVASAGTANGVLYLNGSKVATSGSALTFDGSTLGTTGALRVDGNTTLGDTSTDTVRVNGYIGVGGSPNASFGINVSSAGLTGPTQVGVISYVTGSSAATTSIRGFSSAPSVADASFTVTDVAGYWSTDAIKGASSTVANQHGVYISDQTQGTNNYGVTSRVSSGTGKWNIYASGTANNYFAGNIGLGVTPSAWSSAWSVIDIKGSGAVFTTTSNAADASLFLSANMYSDGASSTANAKYKISGEEASMYRQFQGIHSWFTAPSGTAGNPISFSQAMTLTAAGRLGVGTTSPNYVLEVANSSGTSAINIVNNSSNESSLLFGTNASPAAAFSAIKSDGRSTGNLQFWTNNTERARIDASGNLIHTVTGTAPTLSTNGTMSFELTSDTSLKIVVRGSDGTTRSASLTLA